MYRYIYSFKRLFVCLFACLSIYLSIYLALMIDLNQLVNGCHTNDSVNKWANILSRIERMTDIVEKVIHSKQNVLFTK